MTNIEVGLIKSIVELGLVNLGLLFRLKLEEIIDIKRIILNFFKKNEFNKVSLKDFLGVAKS